MQTKNHKINKEKLFFALMLVGMTQYICNTIDCHFIQMRWLEQILHDYGVSTHISTLRLKRLCNDGARKMTRINLFAESFYPLCVCDLFRFLTSLLSYRRTKSFPCDTLAWRPGEIRDCSMPFIVWVKNKIQIIMNKNKRQHCKW